MHRKAILIFTGLLVGTAATAQAALAPNYQRAKEMTDIIEAVAEKVPAHPITKIIYQKPDQYQVIAGPCSIRANIVELPRKNEMVGSRAFIVKLTPPKCDK